MKKLFKKLFCIHYYTEYWTIGDGRLFLFQPYYDAWIIKKCKKCGKEVEL